MEIVSVYKIRNLFNCLYIWGRIWFLLVVNIQCRELCVEDEEITFLLTGFSS